MSELSWRRRKAGNAGVIVLVAVLMVAPLYVDEVWLRMGILAMTLMVGALGLNLLTGSAGQLSLAHAFYVAIGAVGYTYLASPAVPGEGLGGAGLPTGVAALLASGLAGLAGLVFSPVASRLRGIYLGVASFGLVFIGQHILNSASTVSGGYNGRSVPALNLFGFGFEEGRPNLYVAGVPFGAAEKLWYLGIAVAVIAALAARNLLRSRVGRSFVLIRDSEVAAAAMGVNVRATKSVAFLLSSIYAGVAGVLFALSIGNISPDSFGWDLSVEFLVVIIIGGLGSITGAVVGSIFVAALPVVFQQYSADLPLIVAPGDQGVTATDAAQYLYGAAILAIVLFVPGGLTGLFGQVRAAVSDRLPKPAQKLVPAGPAPDLPEISK